MTQSDVPAAPPETGATSEGMDSERKGLVKKLSAQPTFCNLSELLQAAYSGKRRRLHLKKADISAISSAAHLNSDIRGQLLSIAADDRSLEVTLNLMLLIGESFSASPVRGSLLDFVHDVLAQHPAFSAPSLSGVLRNLPDAPHEDRAIQILLQQNYVELMSSTGSQRATKKTAGQCRINALRCLLLWFHETRVTSLHWLHQQLAEALWKPAGKSLKSDIQKIALLLQAREPAVLAVACSVLEGKVSEHSERASQALRDLQKANESILSLEDAVADLQASLERVTQDLENLKRFQFEQQKGYEESLSHLRDDMETMRGQVLRRLKEDVALLGEGIHALHREPPKVHVMLDHAERVLDALKAQMAKLKEGG